MIDNMALNMLLVPVFWLAAWSWWGALRNPRRRVWREDRRALRAWQQTRRALR